MECLRRGSLTPSSLLAPTQRFLLNSSSHFFLARKSFSVTSESGKRQTESVSCLHWHRHAAALNTSKICCRPTPPPHLYSVFELVSVPNAVHSCHLDSLPECLFPCLLYIYEYWHTFAYFVVCQAFRTPCAYKCYDYVCTYYTVRIWGGTPNHYSKQKRLLN